MSRTIVRFASVALLVGVTTGAHAQSTNLNSYVLFALEELHTKQLSLTAGDVGVNDADGRLISKGPFSVPTSAVAAAEVRFNDRDPECRELFANTARGTDTGCDDPQPFVSPFTDVKLACGFPDPFPACDPSANVVVEAGETLTLAPGVYGNLDLDGGPRGSGTVVLGGDYVFCSISTGRDAAIEFGGPSVVAVAGDMKIGRSSAVMHGAVDPETIRFYVAGDRVVVIQRATVTGVICAPDAKLSANHGVELNGRYIARDIRLKRSAVQSSGPPTCSSDSDCPDGTVCVNGMCQEPSCTDGILNGAETDVDCGGGTCPACPDGGGCQTGTDCESGVCTDGICQPAACTDGVQNGTETGVDCGGDLCPTCPDGGGCQNDSDCQSGNCVDGTCQPGGSCTDGILNGTETDVDCGGGTCPACPDGGECQTGADCESGVCVDGVCQAPTCEDGVRNGDETDVDCGGGTCSACPPGSECEVDDDCEDGICVDGVCQPSGGCGNGIVDGDELCDGDVPCDPSSPMGAMVLCGPSCDAIDDSQCMGDEICGDCVDNDDDGLVDLSDPDCGCLDAPTMSLTHIRIKRQDKPRVVKRLKVRGFWSPDVPEGFDPKQNGLLLQLDDDEGMIFCANFEAAQWKERNRRFMVYRSRVRRPRGDKPTNGLKLARFKVTDEGPVIFKARGPRARVDRDIVGEDIMVRVKTGDMCTESAAALRNKKRRLVFP